MNPETGPHPEVTGCGVRASPGGRLPAGRFS